MSAWLFVTAALAAPPKTCTEVGLTEILQVEAPAVIVLGERHGTQPDLLRARRLVSKLQSRAPVTLAIEAVKESMQTPLNAYAAGTIASHELPDALDWSNSWGFPWAPYRSLVTAAQRGVQVVAAGPDLGPAPDDAKFPIPTGYFALLSDAMASHPVPPEFQDRFVRSMAWRDYRITENAVNGWNHEGFLVILTGRGHVEGGRGVAWQAARLQKNPVHSVILAKGAKPPCYPGDRLWTFDPLRDLGLR